MNKSTRLLALLGAAVIAASACTSGGASTAPSSAATPAASAPASTEASAGASPSAAAFDPSTVDPKSLLGIILSSGKIRISTDPNYKPFSFLNTATNTYEGFDTSTAEETVKRLSTKLGKEITIDWQTPGWDLLEQTRRDVEAETRRALQEIRNEIAGLTVLATEKVTRKSLSPEDQQRLVQEALAELDFTALAQQNGGTR